MVLARPHITKRDCLTLHNGFQREQRALISESYFIKLHLTRTKINSIFNLLVKEKSSFRSIEYQALLNCLNHDGSVPSRELQSPLTAFEDSRIHCHFIGSCNGLVCMFLRFTTPIVMVWNPCTKHYQILTEPPPVIDKNVKYFGFGYDSSSDDYKVVLGGWDDCSGDKHVVVCSLKTGAWRRLESLNRHFRMSSKGYLVNEALHWVVYDRCEQHKGCFSRIGAFDLAEEKFHEIPFPYPPIPVEEHNLYAGVGILNHCLTLDFETRNSRVGYEFKMWVMKEYGVKESWTEVINIPLGILGGRYTSFTCLTCISENGELLMSHGIGATLAIYNPKEKRCRIFLGDVNGSSFYGTCTYVETLVSPYPSV